jgi:hypothetical protein
VQAGARERLSVTDCQKPGDDGHNAMSKDMFPAGDNKIARRLSDGTYPHPDYWSDIIGSGFQGAGG